VKVNPQLLQRCSFSLLTYRIGSRCQRLKRAYRSFKDCQLILFYMIKENGIHKLFHCKSIEKPSYIVFHRSKTENQPIVSHKTGITHFDDIIKENGRLRGQSVASCF
jgi:hypothetical protein